MQRFLKAVVDGTTDQLGRPVDTRPLLGARIKRTKVRDTRCWVFLDAGQDKPGHVVVFPSVASYEAAVGHRSGAPDHPPLIRGDEDHGEQSEGR